MSKGKVAVEHDPQSAGKDEEPNAAASAAPPAASTSEPNAREYGIEEVTIDSSAPGSLNKIILEGERSSARNGLIVGLVVILVGVALLIVGVTGTVDITFASGGTNGHLVTSALGIVVALIGAGIIYVTRYRVSTNPPRKDGG
jgi:hypothetical protein